MNIKEEKEGEIERENEVCCVSGVALGGVGLYRIDEVIYARHLFIDIHI
jgi:hypothetical protein